MKIETMKIEWVEGFSIKTAVEDGKMMISANREGLLSLAKILTGIAQQGNGCHIHLDEYNSLEEGSKELIIEKTE